MDKDLIFQKLTPRADADISTYEEAIDYALQNDDIRNVAISGAYGAGKSSVLESYKAKHKEYRFVHISLAHFDELKQESDTQSENIKESVLEGKILNQLIHQIPAEKIPQTNFKVKRKADVGQSKRMTAFISILVCCIAYLLSFSLISLFVDGLEQNWVKCVLSALYSPYAAVLVVLICAVCIVVAIYLVIQAQKNRNILHKVSLQGNEIELFSNQEDSFFDKYLNEVLYLFDNVGADIIVFEDMDRFNANQIFERLREVNTLINVRRKMEQGTEYKPLRFFYLLRDDIFESKDRTKFFDYIVPIVPVVDGSNSYEKFAELLREAGLVKKFKLSFLQSLCLYIDDMRVLKNIYNEFVVYFNRLDSTDLNPNKMLALITYKNLFPRDFSDLQLGKGYVFALFWNKPSLVQATIAELNKKRQTLIERIDFAKEMVLESETEIEDAYKAKRDRLPKSCYRSSGLTPDAEEKDKEYQRDRDKKKQALKDRLAEKMQELEEELAAIDRSVSSAQARSLQELITRNNVDTVFSITRIGETGEITDFKGIRGSDYFDLLKYLIRSGYIDETYPDYMTYFYEGSITQNDKIFLRRITDKRGAAYDYPLREPKKVIESPILRTTEFEQEETLNYDLLECLLSNCSDPLYETYLVSLIGQIKKTRNYEFISKFYDYTEKACPEFVFRLNDQWPSFFAMAEQRRAIPSSQLRKFSIDTLYFSGSLIERVNVDECLTTYISESPDFLAIENPNIEALISGFVKLKVSFSKIDYDKAEKNLFNAVYENSLYELSFENIELMLRKIYGVEDGDSIIHQNYTTIKSKPYSSLATYIACDLPEYVRIILIHCDNEITDTETNAIALLNSKDIDTELKSKYIAVLTTKITDISEVTDSALWQFLLDREIVVASVENLVHYFLKQGIDVHLIDYVNALPMGIDYSVVKNVFGEEVADKLYNSVAECNGIVDEKYRDILTGLGYYFTSFSIEGLTNEKIEILIQQGLLQMNKSILDFIREKYKDHLYAFIRKNLDKYLALQTEDIFSSEEAKEIAGWEFDDEKKIALLKFTDEPISVVGKNYTDAVVAYILANNCNSEDMANLCAEYSHYEDEARRMIVTLAEKQIEEIIDDKLTLDDALLSALLTSDNVTQDDKIRLFSNAIPVLNEETCMGHFAELGVSELNGIFSKSSGRRNYEKTELATGILEALQEHGWIYKYKEDERNSDRYVVIKNPPKKIID